MSIFDDITQVLDGLLGRPPGAPSNLTLAGVKPMSDALPTAPSLFRTPNKAEQDALQQQRELAFNTVDIEPMSFAPITYTTSIPIQKITDKVGYDSDNEKASGVFGPPPLPGTATTSSWRTVQLPLQGNFLKIEFLPMPINYNSGSLNVKQKTDQSNFGNVPASSTPLAPSHQYSASRTILIQFDDPSGPLLIARDGSEFYANFNTVYVTFKYQCTRFTVISGQNSSIRSGDKNRNLNLSLGPGYGLWDDQTRHPVPFAFCNEGSAFYTNLAGQPTQLYGTPYTVSKNASVSVVLIDPSPTYSGLTNANVFGTVIGWITGISVAANCADSTINNIHIVVRLSIIDSVNGGETYVKFIPLWLTGDGSTQPRPVTFSPNFNEPIRFQLRNIPGVLQETLKLGITSSNTGNSSVSVAIDGYTWGSPFQLPLGNQAGSNVVQPPCLTNLPFPNDIQGNNISN